MNNHRNDNYSVVITDCIDQDELAREEYFQKDMKVEQFVRVATRVPDFFNSKRRLTLYIPVSKINSIKRCKKPMLIDVYSGSVVKRVSDSNDGTWHRLFSHVNEKGEPCAIWGKSDWNDETYLNPNEYYVPLYYDALETANLEVEA